MVALTRVKFSIPQLHDNWQPGIPRCQGLVFSMSNMCRTHVLSTNMKGLIDTSFIYYLCCGAIQSRIWNVCSQYVPTEENANSVLSYFLVFWSQPFTCKIKLVKFKLMVASPHPTWPNKTKSKFWNKINQLAVAIISMLTYWVNYFLCHMLIFLWKKYQK